MTNNHLSFKEKYSYGLGAIGKDMCCGIIFTYCMLYFTDVLKISTAFVGTLFFVAKFWDAVNDLAMGMIVDNTHTKWGKFRPWLLIGTLINSVVLVCLFTNWGLEGTSLYIFAAVMYVLWGMTYTIMDIPYWSMLPNLTSDPEERDRIAVIPRIFASIGGSLIIGGFGLQIMDFLGKGNAQDGFTRFAWLIAVVFIVTTIITVLNVKSADRTETKKQEKISFKQMLQVIKKNDQLLIAIAVILTFNFAMNCVTGAQTYYFIYVTGEKGLFSIFTMFAGFAEIFGLIIFPKLAQRMSKKTVYGLASGIPVIGLVILFLTGLFLPKNYILTAISGIFIKLGSGLQLGVVTVVLADVVEYGEYKLGTRNESVIFSIQTLLVKFAGALGALFTGIALDLTGYVPDAVQSMATINGIRIIMIGLPIVFVILSFIIYKKCYKLNTQYMTRIMNILSLKREEENQVIN
ncbi:MAG: melibiose:sodium transporter MelB [Intestinibacter sp.]|uniref:melibiose:sodium transporter MelB n=1 Tax=Intestinibacter sp. TaxID=1965304 RepID=UPI003F18D427